MIPAQLVRALRTAAVLTGRGADAEDAVARGEAATHDDVLDLLGAIAEAVEDDLPQAPAPAADPAPVRGRPGRPSSLTTTQRLEVQRLAVAGETNPAIAAALGVSVDAVQRYRSGLGLSGRPGPPGPRVDLDRVRELADGTRSDRELAEALGVSYWSARTLRRQVGAPAADRPRPPPPSGWQDRLRQLHAEGRTVAEIAEATGWAVSTVRQRHYLLRLRAHRPG